MESNTLTKIVEMDELALSTRIDYWQQYEAEIVLCAYAELKRRHYSISGDLIKKLALFCEANKYTSINEFLNSFLTNKGFNSYKDLFENKINNNKHDSDKIYDYESYKINKTNSITNKKSRDYIRISAFVGGFIGLIVYLLTSNRMDELFGIIGLFCILGAITGVLIEYIIEKYK